MHRADPQRLRRMCQKGSSPEDSGTDAARLGAAPFRMDGVLSHFVLGYLRYFDSVNFS